MRFTTRLVRRKTRSAITLCSVLAVLTGAVGCGALGGLAGGPIGGILGLLSTIFSIVQDLPNPIESEFSAPAQATSSLGIIQDRLLGRSVAATAIFTFAAPPSAGALGPDGRLYFAERASGKVIAVHPDTLAAQAAAVLDLAVNSSGQRGINGVCFSPDGSRIFVTYTASTTAADTTTEAEGLENRVSSFLFAAGAVTSPEMIHLTGSVRDALFPSAINTIGKCRVGPDSNLYIAHGDLNSRLLAQNLLPAGLAGKILRLALDGSIPADNPFGADNPIYCLGLRNPSGLAFDSMTSAMYILERGNILSDELNMGAASANFGWPLVQGVNNTDAEAVATIVTVGLLRNPIIDFGATQIHPAGIVVLRGSPYGTDLEGDVLIAQNGQQGQVVRWSLDDAPFVLRTPLLLTAIESGEITDLFIGPNGFVYIVTRIHLYRIDLA